MSVAFDLTEHQDILKTFLLVSGASSIPIIYSAIVKREEYILHKVDFFLVLWLFLFL